jgi:hypothetical protein
LGNAGAGRRGRELKTSVIQTVLGLLLVLSAMLFPGLVESGYHIWQGEGNGFIYETFGLMKSNTPVRTWLWCYFGLGMAVLAAGIVSFFLKGRTSKAILSFVQLSLGILVLVSMIVYVLWVEPDWSPYLKYLESTGNQVLMHHDQAWLVTQIIWKVVSILVGLGVAGTGFMQWRRLRKRY